MINSVINSTEIEDNNDILEKEYHKEYNRLSKKYQNKELETKLKYNLYKKGFSISNIEKIQNRD